MLISFVRTIITYILVVIAVRIMGKRQVGQLEPSELVVTLMISDLATIPLGHVSIPLVHGIIPILTLIVAEATLSFLDLKSRRFRKLLSGAPVIVIQGGKVCQTEMEKLRLNFDDLMEMLRMQGSTDINDIEYGILETSGNLSVILKKIPAVEKENYNGLPFMFVCDGEVSHKALELYGKNIEWLNKKIENTKVSEILFAGVNEDGKFYMQKRKKR